MRGLFVWLLCCVGQCFQGCCPVDATAPSVFSIVSSRSLSGTPARLPGPEGHDDDSASTNPENSAAFQVVTWLSSPSRFKLGLDPPVKSCPGHDPTSRTLLVRTSNLNVLTAFDISNFFFLRGYIFK